MNWTFIAFTALFILSVTAVIIKDAIETWRDRRDFDNYLNAKLEEKGDK